MIIMLWVLRIFFVIVGIWQVIGLVPVVTWLTNVHAVTIAMVGAVVFKAFVAILCWLAYRWLRHLQRQHQEARGPSHPTIQVGGAKTVPPVIGKAGVQTVGTPQRCDEVNAIYARVAEELDSGAFDKGLWTRLYAEFDGDERRTRVVYIKQRAEILGAAQSRHL